MSFLFIESSQSRHPSFTFRDTIDAHCEIEFPMYLCVFPLNSLSLCSPSISMTQFDPMENH